MLVLLLLVMSATALLEPSDRALALRALVAQRKPMPLTVAHPMAYNRPLSDAEREVMFDGTTVVNATPCRHAPRAREA